MKVRILKAKNIFLCLTLTLSVFAVIMLLVAYNSKPLEKCVSMLSYGKPSVIIDAGHGGFDGGAVSENGTVEAGINLSISEKTQLFMLFLGIRSVMTRSDENSLNFNSEKTIKENKNADLKQRLQISREFPECDFLSIHLNKFDQSKYYGAQVFYSENNNMSLVLAESLQNSMIEYLDRSNTRKAKTSPDTVYLMKNINSPAVTIECGFLSNPEEEQKLISDEYQTRIAISITKGYIDYIKER